MGRDWRQWQTQSLNDVTDVIISNVDKKIINGERPVRLCNYTDVYNNQFIRSSIDFMNASATDHEIEKCSLFQGDVVITKDSETSDDIGVPAYVKEDIENLVCGYHLVILRPKTGNIDGAYLFYVLATRESQHQFHSRANGITRFGLRKADIESVTIPLPPLPEQKAIAHILGTLDDKIELNRKMNETLEEMARAIFKSWFIDFDPVKAKAEGRQPFGMDADTAALFPDSFHDSPLGPIPKGWRIVTLGQACNIEIGGDWGNDTKFENAVEVVCLRGVDLELLRRTGYANAPHRWVKKSSLNKRIPTEHDVLIASSGIGPCGRPLWMSPCLAALYEMPVTYSNFCKRLKAGSTSEAIYIDRVLHNMRESGEIWEYASGTSLPNLDATGLLRGRQVILPQMEILGLYSKIVLPIYQRLYSRESVILAELRDCLLPKLLSGEIDCLPNH